ncbi:type II toxin-antitoxin system RelE/ParE family toxin [Phyllobacterium pellucidum]|uniref:type II toxin-antitoxin system RelE/ParE family toxin n=1 Tax=Phyllobacterium pellucidum TaxID=2740464 RepID=UPI001D1420AF|nr:type II toxin-antitoxin system RelE/ParE family toxin [Phyllobacterium sp. T1018]UGY09952.1 type II toxin-antitoxin system RelE/ParE family toxin [Phyllobacterium sp. T1018]
MIGLKQTSVYRKWESKLKDQRARAVIAARLFRLASGLGSDIAFVGGGVSELRIHYGPGYRVYFRRHGEQIVILLCGGDKQTQDRDIREARRLAIDWRDDDEAL